MSCLCKVRAFFDWAYPVIFSMAGGWCIFLSALCIEDVAAHSNLGIQKGDLQVCEIPGPVSEPPGKGLIFGQLPGEKEGPKKSYTPSKAKIVKGEELLRKKIGPAEEEIGSRRLPEANPEGPMSFSIAENNTVYVLDQINGKVKIYKDNLFLRSLTLPSQFATDIEVTEEGRLLVLDSFKEKALFVMNGSNGTLLNKFSLEGPGIPQASSVWAVCFRKRGEFGGIWAETEGRSVRLAMADGTPAPRRISVPGFLSAKGNRIVSASILGDVTVGLYVSTEKLSELSSYTVQFDLPVAHILALHMDEDENVYLGVFLAETRRVKNVVVRLGPNGEEYGRMELPVQRVPDEVSRPLKVDTKGNIYQMIVEKAHVVIRKYRFDR